ncbi:MAG: lipoate--protein ligase [Candidatus Promineifilaceae bacterium]|nr:lipoate--protein ligase [Candidatus Promineifilaceae bacterium]
MLFVDNENITDPRINLAIEEFLLRFVKIDEPLLLFYVNEPAVIIGRNQNTLEEVDPLFVKEHNIHLVRRLSGGGAVYHDLGNLNFSFVTPGQEGLHKFERFTKPVIRVLQQLNVDAHLRGRSDIFVGDRKISGNAQYASKGRMFSHGTLLFNTDIEVMLKAINPRQIKIESKAVKSVRSFVANIQEIQPGIKNINRLKKSILEGIFAPKPVQRFELNKEDWQQIYEISEERYQTWEWNVGRSPQFNVQKSERFPIGKVDVRIDVKKGHIQGVKIYGDFFGKKDVDALEHLLIGARYDPDALSATLDNVEIEPYFGGLTRSEFLELIY